MGISTFEARGNLEIFSTEYPIRSDAITSDLGIFEPLVQGLLSQTDAELGVPPPLDAIVFEGRDFWSNVPHQEPGMRVRPTSVAAFDVAIRGIARMM